MFIMARTLGFIVVLGLFTAFRVYSQETTYGPGYQTIMNTNPAFAGSSGDGILRLSYLNFYPGNNYDLHSFFVSYDSYVPMVHGGAGLFVSNDYIGGIVNDVKGGFSYSYHLQAGKEIFINAGLIASLWHRGFSSRNVVLPDQIDPLGGISLPTSDVIDFSGHTIFDMGAGILFTAGRYLADLSVNHIARPDLSGMGSDEGRVDRKLSVHLSGNFVLSRRSGLKATPLAFGEVQGENHIFGAGGAIGWDSFSVNAMVLTNSADDINLQTGFFFNTGPVSLFYNYSFNAFSGNTMLPASLLHHAGLALSLNNVDKRKIIKTINLPKL
jgi:type IX secretion system PorP/SprF family membrane protein